MNQLMRKRQFNLLVRRQPVVTQDHLQQGHTGDRSEAAAAAVAAVHAAAVDHLLLLLLFIGWCWCCHSSDGVIGAAVSSDVVVK
jgi:hypothetical protein